MLGRLTVLAVLIGYKKSERRGTDADEVATASPPAAPTRRVAATHQGFEREDFFGTWPHVPAPAVLVHAGRTAPSSPLPARRRRRW